MAFKAKRNQTVAQKEIENGKALVDYALSGDLEGVRHLLDAGTSVDADDYNRSLFYKSQNYMTPLLCAASTGHVQVLRLLIDHGASLDACDRFDVTAVHLAAENGHLSCLQLLLVAGAECNMATKYSKHGSYTVPHIGGTTPLHLATQNGHINCIKELILNGSDYNMTDEQGRTSLYIAASRGDGESVITHLRNAVGRDILSLPVKETNETPLHECVDHCLYTCVCELLRHGSDTNYRNKYGFSPLHIAVINSEKFSFDIVRELVTHGYNTDVNLPDSSFLIGKTPLQYVSFNDNSKQERRPHVAAFLIAYGAKFQHIKNKFGNTLLQQELRSSSPNRAILHAMVRTLHTLPKLDSLGIWYSPQIQRLHPIPAEKCAWYQSVCSRPRSLQHLCRCTVRQTLGVARLRKIPQLPLPTTLNEYLLLGCDTLR